MRILAVSDLRVQPLRVLRRLVDGVRPDLVLYAGDDVGRFGTVPDKDYLQVAADVLEACDGALLAPRVKHSRCIGSRGAVLPWQALRGEGHALENKGRDVYLGPPNSGNQVPVVRAVQCSEVAAGEADEVHTACGPFGKRWRSSTVHRVRIGGTAWWAWVHRPSATGEAGAWSSILAGVPHGLAGVIGNDCHPLDEGVFKQPHCHDLGRSPLLVGELAFVGLPGAPRDEEEAQAIGHVLYTKAEARRHLDEQLALAGDRRCILVSHAPPKGVLDRAIRFGHANIGSSVVRELIDHPRVLGVVCGHVHREGERFERVDDCTVINVASHDSPGEPTRFAVIEWTGGMLQVEVGNRYDHHDLRRLDGVGSVYADNLAAQGVERVEEVAALAPTDMMAKGGLSWIGDAKRIVAHAKALGSGKPVAFDARGWIPEPVILVDLETSDQPGGDPWLIGVEMPGGQREQYQQLDPAQHGRQIDAMDALAQRFPEALFVSWGPSDRSALAKAAERVGRKAPSWLRERWLDLYHWFRKQVALPREGLSIGLVAALAGLERTSKLSGFEVGFMYRRYCVQGIDFDVDAVRAYNREDIDSLRAVLDSLPRWLGQDAAAETFEERIVNLIARGGPLTCSQIEEAMALPKKGGMVYPALLRLRGHGSVAQVSGGWDLT